MSTRSAFKISALSFLAIYALVLPAHCQSFSVGTVVTQAADQYSYVFTLNYDQMGAAQSLTDNIWDWNFYVDPSLPTPSDIMTPTGWKSTYDTSSGQVDFYTEGPNGFGSGDFGSDVLLPGHSLSGFGLTTLAAPNLSIAFVTDQQFNQDAATAILPTTLPAAVPEFSTNRTLAAFLFLGVLFAKLRLGRSANDKFLHLPN